MSDITIVIEQAYEPITVEILPLQSGGEGTTIHNELNERDADDAHPISAITGLAGELAGKAAAVHSHVIGDVTGLQGELDASIIEVIDEPIELTEENQKSYIRYTGLVDVDCIIREGVAYKVGKITTINQSNEGVLSVVALNENNETSQIIELFGLSQSSGKYSVMQIVCVDENKFDIIGGTLIYYVLVFNISAQLSTFDGGILNINGAEYLFNETGFVQLELPKGQYSYSIDSLGFELFEGIVNINSNTTLDILLVSDDNIAVLASEYISYVESQGGTAASYDDIYSEYEEMIIKGEIDEFGDNLKQVQNFGLWGYKLSTVETTRLTDLWSLTKKDGNYIHLKPNITTADRGILLDNGLLKIISHTTGDFTGNLKIAYGLNSFYSEYKGAEISHGEANVLTVFDTAYRLRMVTGTNNTIRRRLPLTDVSSGNNFFTGTDKLYKLVFERSVVSEENRVTIKTYRDNTLIHTFAETIWDNSMTTDYMSISATSGLIKLKSFKLSLI